MRIFNGPEDSGEQFGSDVDDIYGDDDDNEQEEEEEDEDEED